MHGKQPLWPSSAMSKHIRPAAKLAGIVKHVRRHVFRHSFATLLKGNGEDVKTVQESLRHAESKVTLDTYTQGLMPVKREATTQGYCDDWTHVDPRNFRKCLIAKVGRVAQLVEQCPFKAWVAGSNPAALTKISSGFVLLRRSEMLSMIL